MVVVALLSVDLVESVDLVSVDLVVNCTLFPQMERRDFGIVKLEETFLYTLLHCNTRKKCFQSRIICADNTVSNTCKEYLLGMFRQCEIFVFLAIS